MLCKLNKVLFYYLLLRDFSRYVGNDIYAISGHTKTIEFLTFWPYMSAFE